MILFKENVLIRAGFNKIDFDQMTNEEFDFHFNLIMAMKNKEQDILKGLI